MHILLVVPRYSETFGEFYQFPLGLGYIAAAMKKAGHTVTGLNLNHHRGPVDTILASKITEIDPDICATGALSPFIALVKTIFETSRRAKPDIINIAGGGVVSGEPAVILDVVDIDVGVVGEGEETIVELLDCLEKSGDLHSVNGIVFRDQDGKTIMTPERLQIKDLGTIAWPDYDVLECEQNVTSQRALDNYFFHSNLDSRPRTIDMITSRSCPFKCTFCFHPTGKTYRERPLDDFFAELDSLVARYQINMVGIIDELFSLEKKRLLEFCERIKPYNLQWLVQLHVNTATEETLHAMRDSGCTYISYGIESMSQPVLDSMLKKSKTHRIGSALDLTRKNRIGIQGNLLFGDSAETLETANESMHWWSKNRQYMVNLTPLTVFPGSPDYLSALQDGLIEDHERANYIENIPAIFNISRMNDKNFEMMGFQVWVFEHSLLNVAPLISFKLSGEQISGRGATFDIVFDCTDCEHRNEYLGVIIPPGSGPSLMLTCRNCLTRWDVKNESKQPTPEQPVAEQPMLEQPTPEQPALKALNEIDDPEKHVEIKLFFSKVKRFIKNQKHNKFHVIVKNVMLRALYYLIAQLWVRVLSPLIRAKAHLVTRSSSKVKPLLAKIIPPESQKNISGVKANDAVRGYVAKKLWDKILSPEDLEDTRNSEASGTVKNFIRLFPGHMLRACGSAVGESPFDPEKHNDFADALCEIGAFGAARLHYQQALTLMPDSERASIGLNFIDSPKVSEQQRSVYFVSWSDDPPPARRNVSQITTEHDAPVLSATG